MAHGESQVVVGIGGVGRAACAAVRVGSRVTGICEQERVTRVRSAGCNPSGLPDEALDLLLARAARRRTDITQFVIAEEPLPTSEVTWTRLNHHRAHAETAYLSSGFDAALVVVCDHDAPFMSAWRARGTTLAPVLNNWEGPGLATVYSTCARIAGFRTIAGDQRFEALARLAPGAHEERFPTVEHVSATSLGLSNGWEREVADQMEVASGAGTATNARTASSLQHWVGDLLMRWLGEVRRIADESNVCLGGSLFHHSALNTVVRTSGLFARTFIPVHPGNAGLALAGVLHDGPMAMRPTSPFLGPSYTPQEIKEVLDNCKLRYDWLSEGEAIDAAVGALMQGRLVAWYEGAMEWGPRALGARSILANPFDRYVLENLNRFLKGREAWRGYALSATSEAARQHFSGPTHSAFMECDYQPLDRKRFAPVLPEPAAALRLQTVDDTAPARFRALMEAFGARTGIACLVNTSFNGFHEPIVCTPRDAIRVFYGTGIDMLLLDRFVITK